MPEEKSEMSQRYPHIPRTLRLRKTTERRIVALLSSLPRAEPEIEVAPLKADFEIDLREHPSCLVPLGEGEEGFHAEYGARDGHELLEASFLRVARRVKVFGTWCLEVYETGGADMNGAFGLIWDAPWYYHLRPGQVCSFDPLWLCGCGEQLPTHVSPIPAVRVIGDAEIEGPSDHTYHYLEHATVSVGGIRHECMRLIYPCQSGDRPESLRLDDIYVSRSGRAVLLRRYRSEEDLSEWQATVAEHEWQGGPADEKDFSVGRTQLAYNGQTFYHWFDTLTDHALGRLIAPEWSPPRTRKRGR